MKRNYLLLLSLSAATAAVGKEFMARIKMNVDATAAPLWIDSRGIGVFLSTKLPARQIWLHAFPDSLTFAQRDALRDLLIIQVGPDVAGPPEAKSIAWLNSHKASHA
ncbi:hypothetical protein [Polaromonas sp. JS666]|uniref:hypothetical protein n=1 Tax=Polaromonas sp. (strain JS666 / ATCC BAA-500) TaxID=296591 RepID=UPI0009453B3A|nr:hypothetical protein [Polaromonas sp. JS666]